MKKDLGKETIEEKRTGEEGKDDKRRLEAR